MLNFEKNNWIFLVKRYLILVILSSLIFNLSAQSTFQKQYNSVDGMLDLITTSDGGVIVFSILALTKFDCSGRVEWSKQLNWNNDSYFNAGDIIELNNGDLMVVLPVRQPSPNPRRYINLIRFDSFGNLIWKKQYGDFYRNQFPTTITQTFDGNFLIGGVVYREPAEEIEDFYFLKVDSLGNLLWTRILGEEDANNRIYSTIIDDVGNSIHVGRNYNLADSLNLGNSNICLLKLNSLGEIIFYKEIENTNFYSYHQDVILTFEGNYLIVDGSYLIKINPNGEIIYSKELVSSSVEKQASGSSITLLPSGEYMISGIAIGFPQYANSEITGIMYTYMLGQDESYLNSRIYNKFQIKSVIHGIIEAKSEGGVNMGLSYVADESPLIRKLSLVQLDENLDTECSYDVSEDFFLSENLDWTIVDIPYLVASNGETFDHSHPIEDYLHDTIITLCENIAKADFTLENPCPNEPVYFTDQSSGNIISRIWNFDNGAYISEEENPVVEFSGTGIFPVQLIVSDGCVTDTLLRDIEILPTFFEELDTTVCSDRSIYFHNNVFTETVEEAQTFVYIDTLTNYLGCDSIVILNALVESCGCKLVFPNVFTPDNDGINDVFYPIIDCDFMVDNYRLLIFNRWGQLVFESENPIAQWDGTYQGKALPMDVLIYKVQYDVKDEDGIDNRQVNQVGDITLIR